MAAYDYDDGARPLSDGDSLLYDPNYLPDSVKTFVVHLYRYIREKNVYEIHQMYDNSFQMSPSLLLKLSLLTSTMTTFSACSIARCGSATSILGFPLLSSRGLIRGIITATFFMAARYAGVPVILDAGGVDSPIPQELVSAVDFLSPNETELGRLTNMPTENFEQISQAVRKCHEIGAKQVLVKLGDKGSALFTEGEEHIRQPMISASKVVDTTGAGDTFTAFAVALVEGKSRKDCLRFAAAAASLCVQVKGSIPSMPKRKSIVDLFQST